MKGLYYRHLNVKCSRCFAGIALVVVLAGTQDINTIVPKVEMHEPQHLALKWKKEFRASIAAPVVAKKGGLIVSLSDGSIVALDSQTRQTAPLFSVDGGVAVEQAPMLHEGILYAAAQDLQLYAYALGNDSLLWQRNLSSWPSSAPVAKGDVLYLGVGNHGLRAFSASTGKTLWTHSAGWSVWSAPLITSTAVYFGSWNGVFYALSPKDGEEVWTFETRAKIAGPAVRADGKLAFVTNEGRLHVLEPASGRSFWNRRFADEAGYSLAADAGRLYAGAHNSSLHCFSVSDGTEKWSYQTEAPIHMPVAVGPDFVAAITTEGHLLVLSKREGELIERVEVAQAGRVASAEGILYVTTSKYLRAYQFVS